MACAAPHFAFEDVDECKTAHKRWKWAQHLTREAPTEVNASEVAHCVRAQTARRMHGLTTHRRLPTLT